MPTYDYQCENCRAVFEKRVAIADMHEPEKDPCGQCGHFSVKKKILTGVIFNADAVKPDRKFVEHLREMRRTIHGNTLPDY